MSIPAIAVASALLSTLVTPAAATGREQAFAPGSDAGARRHAHRIVSVRRAPPVAPHYYARPVYYRPYPYSAFAPFVLGFGPWR